jgi:hypothetical protein
MNIRRKKLLELGFDNDQGYTPWMLNFDFGGDDVYIQLGDRRTNGDVLQLPASCTMWIAGDEAQVDLGDCDREAVVAISECVGFDHPDRWERWIHLPQIRRLAKELEVKIDPLLVMARMGEVEHQRALEGGKSA